MAHRRTTSKRRPARAGLALAAAAVLGLNPVLAPGLGVPRAQAADDDVPPITLRVCNQSSHTASVAVVFVPVDEDSFRNKGWFEVGAGTCRDTVDTYNVTIYVYAETTDGSNRVWSGDFSECVVYPGPFEFWSTDDSSCDDGEVMRDFETIEAEPEPGTVTYNLQE